MWVEFVRTVHIYSGRVGSPPLLVASSCPALAFVCELVAVAACALACLAISSALAWSAASFAAFFLVELLLNLPVGLFTPVPSPFVPMLSSVSVGLVLFLPGFSSSSDVDSSCSSSSSMLISPSTGDMVMPPSAVYVTGAGEYPLGVPGVGPKLGLGEAGLPGRACNGASGVPGAGGPGKGAGGGRSGVAGM